MSFKIVFKIIAVLLLVISIIMCVPLGMAYYFGEQTTLLPLGGTIVLTIIISLSTLLYFRRYSIRRLSTRDGLLFVTLGWILVSFITALPFYFSNAIPSFADAYFEMMSGYTTTGASILTNIEAMPQSLLFLRSLTHWLGGMGIIVLAVAILPLLGVGGLQLIRAEAPGPSVDKITPRVTRTAKLLWGVYIGFTVIETLLLYFGGMSFFDALTHTFGTLATGGFSTKNLSVGHYNSAYIDAVITIFMVLAGVNFVLHYKFLTGRMTSFFKDIELRVYLGVFFVSSVITTIVLSFHHFYESIWKTIQYSTFQCASILTTTGYATTDFEKWPQLAQVVLFILMFVGGCSGSTGGGIKVIRIVALFKQGFNEMKYLLHPRAIFSIKLNGNTLHKNIIYAISGFVFLYIFMLMLTTLVVATSGQNILTSLSTALVTLGNIGPGFGKIGPTQNFAFYPTYIKWFLSFIMMVGRLEIYTVLCLFTRLFWRT